MAPTPHPPADPGSTLNSTKSRAGAKGVAYNRQGRCNRFAGELLRAARSAADASKKLDLHGLLCLGPPQGAHPVADLPDKNLLARLAGHGAGQEGPDPLAILAAVQPDHDRDTPPSDKKLDALLDRVAQLTARPAAPAPPPAPEHLHNTFVPIEPEAFGEADLTDTEVEALILKFLLARGDATGRDIGEQVKLPFILVDQLLRDLKSQQLVCHRGAALINDFQYQLTELGRERARRYAQHCTYFGAAPVSLKDYIHSVRAQSLGLQHPTAADLCRAFHDLLLSQQMLDRLGPAINSSRGLFLFGPPGNGKTSIAQRVTAAFGEHIWIPRAIGIDGEIIRLFDPINHEEMPVEPGSGLLDQRKIDRRWVRIRRPTISAGGELSLSQLEVTLNASTGICEAPLQLKSNCGTLVIDDFGRQRMRIDELLNRWIVPLEHRYDLLNLPNGKNVKVPFDQLIIFSTNLEPRDLVDEAFLRRIPYKIEVRDPTADEFRRLFEVMAPKLGLEYRSESVEYLITVHYKQAGRPFRFCHPRDLLMQIRNYCTYDDRPPEVTNEHFDRAVENYFAVM